jgi:enamine deaminase RidA (YjgF/YER057c/UK114 family)
MTKQIIHTDLAPEAIGTYSQAVRVGDTVYLSGQIPLDPESMMLIDGTEAQIRRVFENLLAVARAAGEICRTSSSSTSTSPTCRTSRW